MASQKQNYIRALNCLTILTEICAWFAEDVMKQFHKKESQNNKILTQPCSSSPPCKPRAEPTCSSSCSEWLTRIRSCHMKFNKNLGGVGNKKHKGKEWKIAWGNVDCKLWSTDFWEVAKTYMSHLNDKKKRIATPQETDISGLMSLFENCQWFDQHGGYPIADAAIQKVRNARNDMMHSAQHSLTDQKRDGIITSFKDFLKQPVFVDPKYNAQQAIDDMEEIRKGNKDVIYTQAIFEDLIKKHLPEEFRKMAEMAKSNDKQLIKAAQNFVPYTCFSGRQTQLEDLASKFDLHGEYIVTATVVIGGLGGVGKSMLAKEYAARNSKVYTGGTYYLSADNERDFTSALQFMAKSLNISTPKHQAEQHKGPVLDCLLSEVLICLNANEKPWLLILDNYDDVKTFPLPLRMILNREGTWSTLMSKCHVLVTTRCQPDLFYNYIKMCHGKLDTVNLTPFCLEESISFLKRRLCMPGSEHTSTVPETLTQREFQKMLDENSDPENYAAVRALCQDDMGNLPLALEQVAALIKFQKGKLDFVEYRIQFQKVKTKLLDAGVTVVSGGHERSAIGTTWNMNLEYIRNYKDPKSKDLKDGSLIATAAIKMMEILTFYHHNKIPRELLKCVLELSVKEEDVNLMNFVKVEKLLQEFSLIQPDQSGPNEYFETHQLIQGVIQENMQANNTKDHVVHVFSQAIQCFRKLSKLGLGCDLGSDVDEEDISESSEDIPAVTAGIYYLQSSCMLNHTMKHKPTEEDLNWICQFNIILTLCICQLPFQEFKGMVLCKGTGEDGTSESGQEDFEDESIADGRAAEVMSQGPPMDVQILKAQILMHYGSRIGELHQMVQKYVHFFLKHHRSHPFMTPLNCIRALIWKQPGLLVKLLKGNAGWMREYGPMLLHHISTKGMFTSEDEIFIPAFKKLKFIPELLQFLGKYYPLFNYYEKRKESFTAHAITDSDIQKLSQDIGSDIHIIQQDSKECRHSLAYKATTEEKEKVAEFIYELIPRLFHFMSLSTDHENDPDLLHAMNEFSAGLEEYIQHEEAITDQSDIAFFLKITTNMTISSLATYEKQSSALESVIELVCGLPRPQASKGVLERVTELQKKQLEGLPQLQQSALSRLGPQEARLLVERALIPPPGTSDLQLQFHKRMFGIAEIPQKSTGPGTWFIDDTSSMYQATVKPKSTSKTILQPPQTPNLVENGMACDSNNVNSSTNYGGARPKTYEQPKPKSKKKTKHSEQKVPEGIGNNSECEDDIGLHPVTSHSTQKSDACTDDFETNPSIIQPDTFPCVLKPQSIDKGIQTSFKDTKALASNELMRVKEVANPKTHSKMPNCSKTTKTRPKQCFANEEENSQSLRPLTVPKQLDSSSHHIPIPKRTRTARTAAVPTQKTNISYEEDLPRQSNSKVIADGQSRQGHINGRANALAPKPNIAPKTSKARVTYLHDRSCNKPRTVFDNEECLKPFSRNIRDRDIEKYPYETTGPAGCATGTREEHLLDQILQDEGKAKLFQSLLMDNYPENQIMRLLIANENNLEVPRAEAHYSLTLDDQGTSSASAISALDSIPMEKEEPSPDEAVSILMAIMNYPREEAERILKKDSLEEILHKKSLEKVQTDRKMLDSPREQHTVRPPIPQVHDTLVPNDSEWENGKNVLLLMEEFQIGFKRAKHILLNEASGNLTTARDILKRKKREIRQKEMQLFQRSTNKKTIAKEIATEVGKGVIGGACKIVGSAFKVVGSLGNALNELGKEITDSD